MSTFLRECESLWLDPWNGVVASMINYGCGLTLGVGLYQTYFENVSLLSSALSLPETLEGWNQVKTKSVS